MNDAVITRIRKLMSLTADRGASEAEASLAAEHVQRLLAEHNLSIAAVEITGASSGEGGKRVREGVNTRQVYKWQRSLMNAIAELNFCKAFAKFQKQQGRAAIFNGYELIGRVDNVVSAQVMFEYLQQTIERLAREDVGGDPKQFFTKYAHSFKHGCSDRVVSRLQDEQRRIVEEQTRKAKEQDVRNQHPAAASSNLPTVILSDVIQNEKDLNNDFVQGWEPGTTGNRRAADKAENEAYQLLRQARYEAAITAGHSEEIAQYLSWDYDLATATRLATPEEKKPETEAQKKKRQAREEASNRRYWDRHHREQQKIDGAGYRKGYDQGADVSLNRQVDENTRKQLA